ncbi:hypothetical protein [Haliangium ochraceum]|uniref:Lipoprotein n=1 Tax=Haliangium ochraceum (strain DSM 14365 / JCM 11303 / SMP-2) TaxID=502025 RepID=D0LJS4_HALO1|nr:hypothetical protein [Haliangium ochraceum]ACY18431.1 hypothetical protein Hoch_5956 [Haliangium ochraceum DSM 14365]
MRLTVFSLVMLAAVLVACGGAGHTRGVPEGLSADRALEPGDEVERETLRRLPELAPGQAVEIAGATVVAEAPYQAASRRICRALSIRAGDAPRALLACHDAEGPWFLAPPVFPVANGEEAPAR